MNKPQDPFESSNDVIERLLARFPICSDMINEKHVRRVVSCLRWTALGCVPGDIVELGCNAGNMGLYLQAIAEQTGKKYHAYDSFEGLPALNVYDESIYRTANPGDLAVTQAQFEAKFIEGGLEMPIIHNGWFKDQEYPEKISFAFLDGDYYSSILDSWAAIIDRLSPGAIVCVHDYGYEPLPGVKAACDEVMGARPNPMFWDDHVAIYLF